MKILNTLFLIGFFVFSCSSENRLNEKSQKAIFIVRNPQNISTNVGTGIDLKSLDRFDFDTEDISDTIMLSVNSYRKVYLRNERTFKSFVCEKGDTVELDISENDITIKPKGVVLKQYDLSNLSTLYNRNLKDELLTVKFFKDSIFIIDEWTNKKKLNRDYISSHKDIFVEYNIALKELRKKSNMLLSQLNKDNSISDRYYSYHKSQNNFKEYSDILEAFSYSNDNYLREELLSYFENDAIINDEFIAYGYLNKFLKNILIDKYEHDYKEAFDSLASYLSEKSLMYGRLICLNEIGKNYNYSSFKEYKDKFLNYYNDRVTKMTVNNLNDRYDISNVNLDKKDLIDLKLKNSNGQFMTLYDLLEENTNNVIYIDFWASWCNPCREVMPDAEKLRFDYLNEDVVFIYISLDSDPEKWNLASNSEGLNTTKYNLLALNYPLATPYKKLDLKTIPRYLLINKLGDFEYIDAPGPETETLRNVLKSLLTQ